jgi:hypothetical protein
MIRYILFAFIAWVSAVHAQTDSSILNVTYQIDSLKREVQYIQEREIPRLEKEDDRLLERYGIVLGGALALAGGVFGFMAIIAIIQYKAGAREYESLKIQVLTQLDDRLDKDLESTRNKFNGYNGEISNLLSIINNKINEMSQKERDLQLKADSSSNSITAKIEEARTMLNSSIEEKVNGFPDLVHKVMDQENRRTLMRVALYVGAHAEALEHFQSAFKIEELEKIGSDDLKLTFLVLRAILDGCKKDKVNWENIGRDRQMYLAKIITLSIKKGINIFNDTKPSDFFEDLKNAIS